jgi:hypothetical protein
LKELIEQSIKLQERVTRLDEMLGFNRVSSTGEADHPLKMHLSRLKAAYGSDAD